MTDKVIEFPKHKVVRDVPVDVIEERNRKADQKMADALVDDMAGILVTELDNFDVDVQSKTFAKDFIVVVDALKATIFRQFGLDHPFHKFTDKNISIVDADFGTLTKEEIQDKLDEVMADLVATKERLDSEAEE